MNIILSAILTLAIAGGEVLNEGRASNETLISTDVVVTTTTVIPLENNTTFQALALAPIENLTTIPAYVIPYQAFRCPHCYPYIIPQILILQQAPEKKKKSYKKRQLLLKSVMAAYTAFVDEKERQTEEMIAKGYKE
jgi:hypothetical protein